MRTTAVRTSAVLAGAATSALLCLGLTGIASAAPANEPAALFVSPTAAAAGQSVQISGTCAMPTSGTDLPTVTSVTSPAFSGAASFINKASDSFSGTATISSSAADGSYPVTLTCSNGTAASTVQITGGGSKPNPAPSNGGETHHSGTTTGTTTGNRSTTGYSTDGTTDGSTDGTATDQQATEQDSGWNGWEIGGVVVLGVAAAGGIGYAAARRGKKTNV
jgi:hypothetical protein